MNPQINLNLFKVSQGISPPGISPGVLIGISATAATSVLLLLFIILLCICKHQKAKRRAADVTEVDENHVYGDYFDPDMRMEVEDTNDYYSSDYEAGTGTSRTTDNNPYYE